MQGRAYKRVKWNLRFREMIAKGNREMPTVVGVKWIAVQFVVERILKYFHNARRALQFTRQRRNSPFTKATLSIHARQQTGN